jgi:fatty acid desaturase
MIATQVLDRDEIQRFSRRSDWSAVRVVAANWLLIAAIFAAVAVWTNPLTVFLGVVLFGGRQLGLAVLMHDCGHGSMFRSWRANRFVAQWLAAAFIFGDAKAYRTKHARHHRLGGTRDDPDLQNYVSYAVARSSFRRKITRDLTGRTGLKALRFSVKALGWRGVMNWTIAQGAMFGILFIIGHGWLYLMWPAAWMTTYMVIVRIRNASEHAAVQDLFDPDPRKHTRTTYPKLWERLFFAPNYVNYHLDHHILPSVPCYKLPEFHAYLKRKGVLDGAELVDGYLNVVKKLVLPVGVEKQAQAMQV